MPFAPCNATNQQQNSSCHYHLLGKQPKVKPAATATPENGPKVSHVLRQFHQQTNLLPSVLQPSNQHYIGAAVKEQEANQLGTLWKGEKEAGRELVTLSYKSAHSCELDDSEQEKESLFQ